MGPRNFFHYFVYIFKKLTTSTVTHTERERERETHTHTHTHTYIYMCVCVCVCVCVSKFDKYQIKYIIDSETISKLVNT